jgi:outer membrane protein W
MHCRGYGRAVLTAAAWMYLATAHQALAQAPTATTRLPFDIPAQPMAAALNAWAVQANAQVFVDPGPIAHLTAPAVKGVLTARQALRALLAHSNLQVSQGTDGVFVIRPQRVAAVPKPAPPPPAPEVAAPPPVTPLTARQSEGPWLLRFDAAYARDAGTASGSATAAFGGEYLITDQVAVALAITAPRTLSFDLPGRNPPDRVGAHLQSSALSLKYYFAPEQRLRPYVGAGVNVTMLYDAGAAGGLDRTTVGPRLQAGVDFKLGARWMLNADISWAQVRPETAISPGQDIRVDPLQIGVGFVYRFGFLRGGNAQSGAFP